MTPRSCLALPLSSVETHWLFALLLTPATSELREGDGASCRTISGVELLFPSAPLSRDAAMLRTLPGLSVTTPPVDEVVLLSLSSPLVVLLTELSLFGGGGGGPFFRARTAND